MNEKLNNSDEQQPEFETQLAPEAELQPQVEMPEDFEDPEGKAGKWKTVKGDVEIEGKKVEVSYREKVIELPKHRQEETGIKRIRRRELLPPFPEGFCKNAKDGALYMSLNKEFDSVYGILTDDQFPSRKKFIHMFNYLPRGNENEHAEKFKKEGAYFQKIFQKGDSTVGVMRNWR